MKLYILLLIGIATIWCTYGCKTIANYPIDVPSAANVDDRILGKWKFEEDTDKRNYYLIEPRFSSMDEGTYHIKFYNRGGTNRTYESTLYFSKIDAQPFINLSYFETGGDPFKNEGYFFLKIIDANADYSCITTATVNDTTLRELKSSAAVRSRIASNINNPAFYYDTAHFFKTR